jgi:calcium-dependent protein kinase
LYILLSGRPPFAGDNDKEILDAVKMGVFTLASKEWSAISAEAKDLIKQMLTLDPTQRITALDALNHEWIKKKVHETVDVQATLNALHNLRTFRVIIYLIMV